MKSLAAAAGVGMLNLSRTMGLQEPFHPTLLSLYTKLLTFDLSQKSLSAQTSSGLGIIPYLMVNNAHYLG